MQDHLPEAPSHAPVPIRIRGLDHVVLRCRDQARMMRFYTEVLGCTVARRNEPMGLIHLRAGAAQIDLVSVEGELGRTGGAPPGPEGHNVDHFCLRIDPFDHEALSRYFRGHGIDVGPMHHNFGAEGYGPAVYLTDPEGNRFELKGPSSPQE